MMLIKNGRVINPLTKRDEIIDIVIQDEYIHRLGEYHESADYDRIIDATGMIVSPGLIDVHSHFRDPGQTEKEDIVTGVRAAAKGGYTSVICMANTIPPVDNVKILKEIQKKDATTPINVYQSATITKGRAGKELVDFSALQKAGAMGFSDDDSPIQDLLLVRNAMRTAKKNNAVLSFHDEDSQLIEGSGINLGEISHQLCVKGAPASAETVMVARDCMLALETGARINIQHVSSAVSVELIRLAKSLGADIWAEVTPHHFSLTEESVLTKGTLAKMNPPLRTKNDRFALIEGLKDDTLEIIATDHAPHTAAEKALPFEQAPSGVIGLETSLALGITNLVRKGHLTMMKLLGKLTYKPAYLYGLNAGDIHQGGLADLVIFDPSEAWEVSDQFYSKSSNSPFIGERLYGKVKYTICNGKIVYEEGAE